MKLSDYINRIQLEHYQEGKVKNFLSTVFTAAGIYAGLITGVNKFVDSSNERHEDEKNRKDFGLTTEQYEALKKAYKLEKEIKALEKDENLKSAIEALQK